MFWPCRADTNAVARWQFFTNHMHVLSVLAEDPDLRLREIAREVGITERATHRIVTDLVEAGYLTRTRVGARSRYVLHPEVALRHPLQAGRATGRVIRLLTASAPPAEPASGGGPGSPGHHGDPDRSIFQAAFAAVPAAVAILDADGCLLAVNQEFCAILGYSENQLRGRELRDLTHPDHLSAVDDGLSELVSGERSEYAGETGYVRQDGSVLRARLRLTAAVDPQTGARLFAAHLAGSSERARQESVAAEAEERFRAAFDNAPIGMALVAPDGRWLKVNRALCELTGYAETELLVSTFQSITHPDDLHTDLAYLEDVLAGRRRAYQMEKRYRHADGHLIWVMLSVSLVRDPSGHPLYFVSQIEGITERGHAERAWQGKPTSIAGARDRAA